MIKIERIKGVTGYVMRGDNKVTLYLGLLITPSELETLTVKGTGSLTYSVDEQEVVTKEFKELEQNVAKVVPTTNAKVVTPATPKTTKSGVVIK